MSRPLSGEHSFEERVIEAAQVDQLTICLRDLPAFYACATSLIFKLKEVCEARGRQEARFTHLFRELYSRECFQRQSGSVRDTLLPLHDSLSARIAESMQVSEENESRPRSPLSREPTQTLVVNGMGVEVRNELIALAKESVAGVL